MTRNAHPEGEYSRLSLFAIFLCFIFSGMSSLIFEVSWSKALSIYLGNTLYAISTVVAAYMAGLGIGAFIAGRFSARVRYPIRTYGWIEGTVGIFGIASPFLFKLLHPAFGKLFFLWNSAFSAFLIVRFLIIFAILLIPTIAMGMTLPILVSALTSKRAAFGANVAKLYGFNTAGAVCGTFSGGFLMLPILGLFKTIISASMLNLGILCLVYLIPMLRDWHTEDAEHLRSLPAESRTGGAANHGMNAKFGGAILWLFAVSGFLAMVYEVGWTRVLSPIIGSSAYSFAIILSTFLLGIALGSLVIARFSGEMKNPYLVFGALEILLGLSALGSTFLFSSLPGIFASIINTSNFNIGAVMSGEFFLSGLISFVPCFIMGLLFPVAACAYRRSESSPGMNIGRIYFFNTFGAIFGSIITGFIFIPRIGILKSLIAASAVSVLIGIIAFLLSEIGARPKILMAGLALSFTFFLSVLVPPWQISKMNRGFIQIVRDIKGGDPSGGLKKEGKILFYREGRNSTVAVSFVGSDMYLIIGGKIDASAVADATTQILLGQLPMLYADSPKDVCVIGLGAGVTTHSVLLHPIRSVETLEIEDAVVEASKYFYPVNHDPLADPRSRIIVEDARTYLSYAKKKYDVIISEPSNPWISGINSLFTREFYEIVNATLNDGGVFCQWLQTYELSPLSLSAVVKAFTASFPNCHFFYIPKEGDSLLIARKGPISFNAEKLSRFFSQEAVKKDLERINISNPYDLFSYYISPLTDVEKALDGKTLNTDDNSYLEYRAPFEIITLKRSEYSIALGPRFIDDLKKTFFPDRPERDYLLELGLAFLRTNDKARDDLILTNLKNRGYEPEASRLIDEIRKDEAKKEAEMKAYETFSKAEEALKNGDNENAARLAIQAHELAKGRNDLAFNCSLMLLNLGKSEPAEEILRELIARDTFAYTYTSYLNLGSLFWNLRQPEKSLECYWKGIAYNPYLATGYVQIAQAYAGLGEKEKARECLQQALKLEPLNEQVQALLKSF